ncbi:MAG: PAS domain S-box protein [Rhodocyclales bacterium]|nr:PAS domain S-box protein [Rhodocyclales bacterium]
MTSTLRTSRVTVILSAITVATITAMTILLLWQLRVQELRHAEGETVSLSHIIAEQTTRSLQSVDLALDVALDRLEQAERLGVSHDEFAIHAMLRSRVEGMPQLRSMFITDADGKIASSALSHPAPNFSVKDRDYFTRVRDRTDLDRYVSSPVINRVDGKRTLFFSRRIRNPKGEFVGVIAASLDIAYVESLYDSIKLDSVSSIALHLDDGTLVARAPHDEALMADKELLPTLQHGEKERTQFKTVRTEGEDAGIVTYRQVSRFPMVLGVGNRDRDALEGWRGTARMIIAAAVVNILLVLGVMAFLLRRQRREAVLAAAAKESDDQLRAMVESAMDAIITIDSERRIVVFNPAAQSMFGYSAEEVRGSPLDRLLPERFRAVHEGNVNAFRQSGITARMKKARMEIVGLRADGSEFPLESTIAQVTIRGQTLFTAILRDISERRRAEDELRDSNRQLRELATSLQTVREEERTSIARELHDELGQQLLRLRMDLDWVAGRLKELAPALHEKVGAMKHFIEGTVDALRHVTTRLRPPLLDDLGLADAARWQLDEFAQRSGIEVVATIAIDDLALDEHVAISAFRILQESLTNVARHAGATRVDVSLAGTEEGLALDIRDNGCGTELRDKPQLGHGLVGIRERTLLLGGRMEIISAPGDGFAIMVRIPLRGSEPAGEQK